MLPNVVDVFVDPSAGRGFTVHIAIEKKRIGEPKLAMMRAYTAPVGFCKHVFVYDDDIGIRNPRDRDWPLTHRCISNRELMITPNVPGMIIEARAQGVLASNAKLGVYDGYPVNPLNVQLFTGVDCTVPLGLRVMDRVVPVPEMDARIDAVWKVATA